MPFAYPYLPIPSKNINFLRVSGPIQLGVGVQLYPCAPPWRRNSIGYTVQSASEQLDNNVLVLMFHDLSLIHDHLLIMNQTNLEANYFRHNVVFLYNCFISATTDLNIAVAQPQLIDSSGFLVILLFAHCKRTCRHIH
jgi:hypothetical protein